MRFLTILGLYLLIGGMFAGEPPHLAAAAPVTGLTAAPLGVAVRHTGTEPIAFSASGLPAGMWVNPVTGYIAGSPSAPGSFVATIMATNPFGSDSVQVSFTIAPCGPLRVASWGEVPAGMPTDLPACSDVAVGYQHTLALGDDGTVRAWGGNTDGQCDVPNTVVGAIAVGAGGLHSLALLDDGTVVAWGRNDDGQCDVPVGLGPVAAIAAGRAYSLALLQDGTVAVWGGGPGLVVPPGLTDVVAIAGADYHVLALRRQGTVTAWGSDFDGQSTVPDGLDRVVGIAAGSTHSMALRDDGRIFKWGAWINGAPPRDLRASMIAANWGYGLALANGRIFGWGYDTYGQATGGSEIPGIVRMAAGVNHAVALSRMVPTLVDPGRITAVAGTAVTVPLTVAGAPASFSAVGLPVGWTIDADTGTITGRAQRTGLQEAIITITNEHGTAEAVLPIAVASPATWGVTTGALAMGRFGHTATLLADDRVLVAGGTRTFGNYMQEQCELFDAGAGRFSATGAMTQRRSMHTASLLSDGRVLVTGGMVDYERLASCEIFDPRTGTWSVTTPMTTQRAYHTAIVLPSGQVMVIGGQDNAGLLASCEIYDPLSGAWASAAVLSTPTYFHTATLLSNGDVLVTGGYDVDGHETGHCELYSATGGNWRNVAPMSDVRAGHTATRLPSGRVLVTGGCDEPIRACEEFDPHLEQWIPVDRMNIARRHHTATLLPSGDVLVAGGDWWEGGNTTAEIYRPGDDRWYVLPDLHAGRTYATATLLQQGSVVLIGGSNIYSSGGEVAFGEIFNPVWGTWQSTTPLQERRDHVLITLADGSVLAAGGIVSGGQVTDCETYDPLTGLWSVTGSLLTERSGFVGTLLPSGEVLATGGGQHSSCERYQPGARTWVVAQAMSISRRDHTATLLSSGEVLVVGGSNLSGPQADSEIYDPLTDTWVPAGGIGIGRSHHATILMSNGQVLVCGGYEGGGIGALADCRVFDPLRRQWREVPAMSVPRGGHTATLLPDGRVLVAGGFSGNGGTYLKTCEVFDPLLETWSPARDLTRHRANAAAVADEHGLLLMGGFGVGPSNSSEYLDFRTGVWTPVASMQFERWSPRATRVGHGILVSGGDTFQVTGAEIWQHSSGGSHSLVVLDEVDSALTATGTRIDVSGTGFMPVLGTSQGNTQDGTNRFPLVRVRRQDNGAIAWVMPEVLPTMSDEEWSGVMPVELANGPAWVRVFVNGIASEERAIMVQGHLQLLIDGLQASYDGTAHSVSVVRSTPLDPAAVLSVTYQPLSATPGPGVLPLGPPTADAPTDVGWYDVRVTVRGTQVADARGYLRISPSPLTLTVDDQVRRFGEANPPLTGVMTGVITADGLQAIYTTSAGPASSPGAYAIQGTVADPHGRLANYAVSINVGTLTIGVGQPAITITEQSFTYDGEEHPVSFQVAPTLDAGSTMSVSYLAWSGDPESVGSGPVPGSTPTTAAPVDAGWYRVLIQISGNQEAEVADFVRIDPAQLIITVHDRQRQRGEENPEMTGDISGAVAADNLTVVYSTTADRNSLVGTYPINVAILDPWMRLDNYQVNIHAGLLEVVTRGGSSSSANRCGVGGFSTGLLVLVLVFGWRSRRHSV